ncbi:MAG: flagellar basal-body MS-ring/collar protein FliF, partial [Bacillota bacterium]|nr:flagellar basal-body MS-ring/collar protein FliF [Bacillota bacterium]
MHENIKKYIDPLVKFWNGMAKKTKKIVVFSLCGIVLAAFAATLFLNRPQYAILYPGLESDEASEIGNLLESRNVSYKIHDGTISVPKDREASLRMELANLGYPKTTLNYDYFTKNIDVMSTDYEKKVIEKYQLNQRLEAVIKTLDPIKNATVIISIPDENGYAWDESKAEPSASAALELKPGKTLSGEQVSGIKRLIAKSVPNLKPEEVVVVDSKTGDELSSSEGGADRTDLSEFKLKFEKKYEQDIKEKVLDILSPIYGEKNVNVSVKAIMDVDKKIQEVTTYEPSENNTGVVSESSQQTEQANAGTKAAGGVAGTDTNSETPTYPGTTENGNNLSIKESNNYKYLVSQIKKQIEGDAASVTDMTIAVAVNNDALSSDDKDELSKLVASTAAIDPSKVTIYASAFYNPEDQEKENGEAHVGAPSLNFMALLLSDPTLLLFAGAGLLALLILIFLLKSIAKKRKRKKEKMAEPAALGQTENKKGFKGKLKKKKHKKGEPEEA